VDKKYVILYLFLILLVGTFFRLWQLDSVPPGLYHDEAINANNALEAEGEWKWFYPDNNGREGLYINLLTIPLSKFGNEPWAIRLVSAIFGILTILGLFLLTKELFKNLNTKYQILNTNRIALFSSFFLATSFWHILFSRIGFRAIMAPFFLVWAFYFLWKSIKTGSSASTWKPSFQVALAGLLFGLGFHTYIAYRIAPLLLIIPFWKLWQRGQKKIIALFLFATFMAGLPLGLYFLDNPADFFGRTSQISIFSSETPIKNLGENISKTIGMLFYRGDYNWRHNLSGSPQLFWPISILFLIGFIISVKKLRITHYALLITWLVIMSLPVVVSNEGLPHALRAIILIPPIMIFSGLGLDFIVTKVQNWHEKNLKKYPNSKKQLLRIKKHLVLLLFIFFTLIFSHTFVQYFQRWGTNINTYHAFNGRYYDIGKYLDNLPTQTQKYVIVNATGVKVPSTGSGQAIPMPAQTIMFVTNSYSEIKQRAKRITYLLPDKINEISCSKGCVIITLDTDGALREKIKNKIPGLKLNIEPGIEVLER